MNKAAMVQLGTGYLQFFLQLQSNGAGPRWWPLAVPLSVSLP